MRMKTLLPGLAALLLLTLLVPLRAAAHPHVYVDVSLRFRVDDNGVQSVHQRWLFDEIFTQAILSDLGLTAATIAPPEGQEAVRQGAFQYLSNYGYFTLIENAGQRLPVNPEGFRVSLNGERMVYDFDVPLHLPLDQVRDFRLAVFDREYYTDVVYAENGIDFQVDGQAKVGHSILPAKDHTYWQFIVPNAVHLTVSGAAATSPQVADQAEPESPGPMAWIMSRVRSVQKELTQRLNGFGKAIQDNPLGPALWMFLGLSFVYGVVHAVGPGHGKAVVCSYFLSNPGSLMSGAIMGNAITFVHMTSAAAAVGVAYLIFSSGMGGFAEASRAIQPASYGLLAAMGAFLFVKAARDLLRGGLLPDPSCSHGEEEGDDLRSILAVSFITGLIPCPGAAVILAFSIGLNIFWAGVMALIVMAAGMGLTTTLFAWFAVTARSATLKLSGRNRKLLGAVHAALSLTGAAAIGLFGAALLVGSLTA